MYVAFRWGSARRPGALWTSAVTRPAPLSGKPLNVKVFSFADDSPRLDHLFQHFYFGNLLLQLKLEVLNRRLLDLPDLDLELCIFLPLFL